MTVLLALSGESGDNEMAWLAKGSLVSFNQFQRPWDKAYRR
ncbi:hypothetical protein NON20_20400 [Synechocystis sp. B12]|nr:hypothetical protein NON20_20400 [Synechocystis sp. B12]